jgi:hypothetical protein
LEVLSKAEDEKLIFSRSRFFFRFQISEKLIGATDGVTLFKKTAREKFKLRQSHIAELDDSRCTLQKQIAPTGYSYVSTFEFYF